MTTATLAYHRVQKNIKAQMKGFSFPTINPKMLLYAMAALVFMLLLFYVWQINELTRGSYAIDQYSRQVNQLMSQNKDLEVNLAQTSFMGESLAKIEALNFKKATSVRYIQILDTSLASASQLPAN